ncbi:hypothetical protein SALBM311S_05664 [Streptomyces alboniger]
MQAIAERVSVLLSDQFKVKPEIIAFEVTLGKLSFDSLVLIELGLVLDKEFGVEIAAELAEILAEPPSARRRPGATRRLSRARQVRWRDDRAARRGTAWLSRAPGAPPADRAGDRVGRYGRSARPARRTAAGGPLHIRARSVAGSPGAGTSSPSPRTVRASCSKSSARP